MGQIRDRIYDIVDNKTKKELEGIPSDGMAIKIIKPKFLYIGQSDKYKDFIDLIRDNKEEFAKFKIYYNTLVNDCYSVLDSDFSGLHPFRKDVTVIAADRSKIRCGGVSNVVLRGRAYAEVLGDSKITLMDESTSMVFSNSFARVKDRACASLQNKAKARAFDKSKVYLNHLSEAELWDGSRAMAMDHSICKAFWKSLVLAKDNSTVLAYNWSKVRAKDNSFVDQRTDTVQVSSWDTSLTRLSYED